MPSHGSTQETAPKLWMIKILCAKVLLQFQRWEQGPSGLYILSPAAAAVSAFKINSSVLLKYMIYIYFIIEHILAIEQGVIEANFLRVFGFLFWILSFLRPPQDSTKLLNLFTNNQTKCNANILIIIHLPMSILAAQEHVLAS